MSALVHDELSAIDRRLGELAEQWRQLKRIENAWQLGEKLSQDIADKEKAIEPLAVKVEERLESVDFGDSADSIAAGINDYLNKIKDLRPGVWKHSPIALRLSQSQCRFKVGQKDWFKALGGTDQLYFLMAYHYGLLSLTPKPGTHYPGLAIIDVPADFAGESIRDLDNFVVEPFISLLRSEGMAQSQVIITGSSFQGLQGAHRILLNSVWSS